MTEPVFDALLRGSILAVAALLWVLILVRVNGLQTLSKMTNFDFVATVAFGSLLAGAAQATQWTGYLQALVAIACLIAAQALISVLRERSDPVADVIGNQPCLLMRDGEFCDDALTANKMRREDLIAKLREANVLQLHEVRAAILEATGDVSVLHGEVELDEILLKDVA